MRSVSGMVRKVSRVISYIVNRKGKSREEPIVDLHEKKPSNSKDEMSKYRDSLWRTLNLCYSQNAINCFCSFIPGDFGNHLQQLAIVFDHLCVSAFSCCSSSSR